MKARGPKLPLDPIRLVFRRMALLRAFLCAISLASIFLPWGTMVENPDWASAMACMVKRPRGWFPPPQFIGAVFTPYRGDTSLLNQPFDGSFTRGAAFLLLISLGVGLIVSGFRGLRVTATQAFAFWAFIAMSGALALWEWSAPIRECIDSQRMYSIPVRLCSGCALSLTCGLACAALLYAVEPLLLFRALRARDRQELAEQMAQSPRASSKTSGAAPST